MKGWTIPLITVGSMFSHKYSLQNVSLRPAPIKYTVTHLFLSAVYIHFRHYQLSLYLVCFDSISTKDNLIQLSGTVWQAFSVRALQVYGLRKSTCLTTVWLKRLTGKALEQMQIISFFDCE